MHVLCYVMHVLRRDMRPLYVVGDGNCLYRAVSRALNGDENQHALRLTKNCSRDIIK